MTSVLANASSQSALIVGCGSIGRRHATNLRSLGIQKVAVVDPDEDRLRSVVSELGVEPFHNLPDALSQFKPGMAFICTPPVFHVAQAMQAAQSGAHIFIEKPLSDRLDGIEELALEVAARKCVAQVGYNLRFHPGIRQVKALLDGGAIGKLLWARAEAGQYLPDWRPWQDYRQSYTARRELGGGIILDGSHEIDYMLWFLGRPAELCCMAGTVSGLQVDTEDCATLLMRFATGAQADIHLDFVQRAYSRSAVFAGETGTLLWDYVGNQIRIKRPSKDTEVFDYQFQANDMYVSEARHFLECVQAGQQPEVGLADGKLSLEVALAARNAASEKKWVAFG